MSFELILITQPATADIDWEYMYVESILILTLIARFMGPTWG